MPFYSLHLTGAYRGQGSLNFRFTLGQVSTQKFVYFTLPNMFLEDTQSPYWFLNLWGKGQTEVPKTTSCTEIVKQRTLIPVLVLIPIPAENSYKRGYQLVERKQGTPQQQGVWKSTSILTLYTQKWHQIPQVNSSVTQDGAPYHHTHTHTLQMAVSSPGCHLYFWSTG